MILSGRDVQLYLDSNKLKITPIRPEQIQQNGVDLVLADVQQKHGPFHLGCTQEVLSLPDDLMAFVEIRSSWARRGVFLPPTIVDAGFCGNLTLEILSFGCDLKVAIGNRFAHLIFAKTTGPCIPYDGVYQGQRGITERDLRGEHDEGCSRYRKPCNECLRTECDEECDCKCHAAVPPAGGGGER
jgi:dCTP deaminase